MPRLPLFLAMTLTASMALAHGGVQNPAVMARMDAMKGIGDGMKVLGSMVKGDITFDTATAQAALDRIKGHAAQVPALFKAPETDPKSEALPAIWNSWVDFEDNARAMETAADVTITDPASLTPTVGALAGSCKACHRDYRVKQ